MLEQVIKGNYISIQVIAIEEYSHGLNFLPVFSVIV